MGEDEANNHLQCSRYNWKYMNDKLGVNKLSVVCYNACNKVLKLPELCPSLLLLENQHHFIVITETRLNVIKCVALEISGYKSSVLHRPTYIRTEGGAITIYWLDSIHARGY